MLILWILGFSILGSIGAIAGAALGASDVEALKAAPLDGKTVADVVTAKIAKIGENMTLRRMAKVEGG